MTTINYKYISQLVELSKRNNSNAFAELFAVTYRNQYILSYSILRDSDLSQSALQETYTLALRNITSIEDPALFTLWLNQINLRVCLRLIQRQQNPKVLNTVTIGTREYSLRQILLLPFSESQSIFLKYRSNMTIKEIANIMGCSKSAVNRYINRGQNRLRKILR